MDKAPTEIRNMIYKLCLPTGNYLALKLTPCDKEETKGRRGLRKTSFPALLQVNQKIREEAAPIFYGANVWKIIDVPKRLELPDIFLAHVREARVTFDRRIMNIHKLWAISDKGFKKADKADDRLQEIHDRLKNNLLETWQEKCSTLREMSSLTELEVELKHCNCPIGCCRMVEDIFAELDGRVDLEDDRRVEVTGMVFEYEAELLHTGHFRCEACYDGDDEEEAEDCGYCWRSRLPEEIQ